MTDVCQLDEKYTLQARWTPLKLCGFPGLQLSQCFQDTDDLQALTLSVRIEPGDLTLKYGMSRRDLGSAWHDDEKAQARLKTVAEAKLKRDLVLFFDRKKVPDAALRITWIDYKGRVISYDERTAG